MFKRIVSNVFPFNVIVPCRTQKVVHKVRNIFLLSSHVFVRKRSGDVNYNTKNILTTLQPNNNDKKSIQ